MVLVNRPSAKLQPYTLRPDDPQVVSFGARIYAQQCAACHGVRGEGQSDWRERGTDGLLPAPPHDPSGHTWHHPDSQLFAITKFGLAKLIEQPDYKTAMPIYDRVLSCRIPDDCIDPKRYPLFMARAVLQELIESLQSTRGVKSC